jgi:hypothetical protein
VGDHHSTVRKEIHQTSRHHVWGPDQIVVARIALQPLGDEIGRKRLRRIAPRQCQRRQPGKTVQSFGPLGGGRNGIENRTLFRVENLSREAKSSAQHGIGIF